MRWLRIGSAGLLAFALAACESVGGLTELEVPNENNPDRSRVIVTAEDLESLIPSAMNVAWAAFNDGSRWFRWGSPSMALGAEADEWSLSWGNYDIKELSSEPRKEYNNSPSYRYAQFAETPWYHHYEAVSTVYDALNAIVNDTSGICEEINCDRAMAFGRFIQGISHGWIALQFDSGFVMDETIDLETDTLALVGYDSVWRAAEFFLNDAITRSQGGSWQLEPGWLGASGTLSATELAQLTHAQLARWMPMVARTPAERDAVDWNAVLNHVNNAITDDFFVEADADLWWSAPLYFNFINFADNSWSRADYKAIGWLDTTGAYANWLATLPVANRNEMFISTPDERIMPGGDSLGEGLDFRFQGPSPFPVSRGTYHFSFYSGTRYESWAATEVGPMPYILKAELDLIKAEALLRTGGVSQQVADLINNTRVTRGGLPPATNANTAKELMEMIMYERIIENYGFCSGCTYFNKRGWESATLGFSGNSNSPTGPNHHWNLVEGSQVHWAPPGKELETLDKPIYTYGGVGKEGPTWTPSAPMVPGTGTRVPAWKVYMD
ncbi:MAG: hypothetical protein ACE5PT_09645, partial [Gemmatimonadales bacterium]